MTRVHVTASPTIRPAAQLPIIVPPEPIHGVATTAAGTTVATTIEVRRPHWAYRWVHGWGGAPFERWLPLRRR